jgi:hypothetical protein
VTAAASVFQLGGEVFWFSGYVFTIGAKSLSQVFILRPKKRDLGRLNRDNSPLFFRVTPLRINPYHIKAYFHHLLMSSYVILSEILSTANSLRCNVVWGR